jgi:hypothetical protein
MSDLFSLTISIIGLLRTVVRVSKAMKITFKGMRGSPEYAYRLAWELEFFEAFLKCAQHHLKIPAWHY